jgi:hypothetical protein
MPGTEGQDWAGYQPAEPSTAGLDFVIVKATEGTTYTNPKHASQVAVARTHGLVVGHYHFARPGSMLAQADYFLQQAAARPGEVLAFDWEDPGVTDWQKDTWLRYVQGKAPQQRVILYCNQDYWLHRDATSFCADGLWIADPSAPKGAPRIEAPWLFHQYGSPGGLDRNYTRLSAAELRAWAARIATPEHEEDDVSAEETWAYKNTKSGDRHDMHQALVNAEANSTQALAQARANGAALSALSAKVAAMPAPTIDYAKLAAALLTAVKED